MNLEEIVSSPIMRNEQAEEQLWNYHTFSKTIHLLENIITKSSQRVETEKKPMVQQMFVHYLAKTKKNKLKKRSLYKLYRSESLLFDKC